jgi:ComF family protein
LKALLHRRLLRRLGESFMAAVFPVRCLVCGAFFRPPSSAADAAGGAQEPMAPERLFARICAAFVCPGCAATVAPVASPLCPACGIVFQSRQGEDHLCGRCLAEPRHFDSARAFGLYQGPLMALVHQLKYRRKSALGVPLGRLLHATYAAHCGCRPPELVVPVPLHARRLRQRGFNQAHQLVRAWPQFSRRTPAGGPRLARGLLLRRHATPPQTGLGRRDRRANIKGAFAVADPRPIAGRRILLVDDVMTTGATLDECARVLRAAGAAGVDCLTLARSV